MRKVRAGSSKAQPQPQPQPEYISVFVFVHRSATVRDKTCPQTPSTRARACRTALRTPISPSGWLFQRRAVARVNSRDPCAALYAARCCSRTSAEEEAVDSTSIFELAGPGTCLLQTREF